MAFLNSAARSRFAALLLISMGLFSPGATSTLQVSTAKEIQVKAAFMLHFPEFVEWPSNAFADASSALVVGVLGSDPFGQVLDETMRGEKVNNHPLVIRRFSRIDEITACHVLFISRSESGRLDKVLASLKGRSILTVGDLDDFSRRGGMIKFAIVNDKTRLSVNLEAAKTAHLTISSKLLKRAQIETTAGG